MSHFLKKIKKYLKCDKLKVYLASIFLFTTTFLLSFYRATNIQGQEDFIDSRQGLIFLSNPSIENLMYESHNGLEFFALPFYYLFGFNLSALRLSQSVALSITVVVFFFFCKYYFRSFKKALLTSILLVSIPFFILLKYWPEYAVSALFSTILLYLFFKIRRSQNPSKLFIAFGFLWGFATYYKLILFAFGFSLILAYLIIDKKSAFRKIFKLKNFGYLLFSAALGATPFILYNMEGNFFFLKNLQLEAKEYGVSSVFNFSGRIAHIYEILTSSPLFYFGEIKLIGLILVLILGISSFYFIYNKKRNESFLLLTSFLYLFFTSFEVMKISVEHLYIIITIFVLIISSGIFIFSRFLRRKISINLVYFLFFIVFILNFLNIFTILRSDTEPSEYLVISEIGYLIQEEEDINEIYTTLGTSYEPSGYQVLFFTSQTPVFYIDEVIREGSGTVELISRETSSYKFESNFNIIFSDIPKNNIYIDGVLTNWALKQDNIPKIKRSFSTEDIHNLLTSNGYKRINFPDQIQRAKFFVWVHEDRADLIKDLKKIKNKD